MLTHSLSALKWSYWMSRDEMKGLLSCHSSWQYSSNNRCWPTIWEGPVCLFSENNCVCLGGSPPLSPGWVSNGAGVQSVFVFLIKLYSMVSANMSGWLFLSVCLTKLLWISANNSIHSTFWIFYNTSVKLKTKECAFWNPTVAQAFLRYGKRGRDWHRPSNNYS